MDTETTEEATRARWVEQEDGSIRLEPKPLVKGKITLGEFEAGCELLGLDPDAALDGEADFADVGDPGPTERRQFVLLALENPEPFDLSQMDELRADAVLAMVATHWIAAARGAWNEVPAIEPLNHTD